MFKLYIDKIMKLNIVIFKILILIINYIIFFSMINNNLLRVSIKKRHSYVYNRKTKSKLITILTKWGESLDKNNILQEYPRPQFVRDSYLNLNGEWDYSLIIGKNKPEYIGKIIVPFSIESPLSGVKGKTLKPGMSLWYRKYVDLTKMVNKGKFLLHFGSVDQFAEVFINGIKVGEHYGGYNSFFFDITNYINVNNHNDLSKVKIELRVEDNYNKDGAAVGKQAENRGGIYYVRTGGIWQTVWIESVPKQYIKDVKITPNYDYHSVSFFMTIEGIEKSKQRKIKEEGEIKIFDNNKKLINSSKILPNIECNITIDENFRSWSPEDPYLYKVEYNYGEDNVQSYFGMRKFSIGLDKHKFKRLFLNNKPYFQKGVLDQGYWSDGYYTPPSDEAIIYDIQTMKDLGFNMLRKHIKIESKRWYYHCDTIGMLVWQDQPSGGAPYKRASRTEYISDDNYAYFNRKSEKGRINFVKDLNKTIEQLYNTPSISTWVIFNEGWGQFDSVKIAKMVKKIDKTRFVDHASGWVDNHGPDFYSKHIYRKRIKINAKNDYYKRPMVLSEFGGYGLIVDKHLGSNKPFAYLMYYNKNELTEAIKKLLRREILPSIKKGLSAMVYTQLSDIEEEVNGFLTYDRKVLKVYTDPIKAANDLLNIK